MSTRDNGSGALVSATMVARLLRLYRLRYARDYRTEPPADSLSAARRIVPGPVALLALALVLGDRWQAAGCAAEAACRDGVRWPTVLASAGSSTIARHLMPKAIRRRPARTTA